MSLVNSTIEITLAKSGIKALAHEWIRFCAWLKRTKQPQFFCSVRAFYTGVLSNQDLIEVEDEVQRLTRQ